jgi:uncharacterized protein (TIGR02145 family)
MKKALYVVTVLFITITMVSVCKKQSTDTTDDTTATNTVTDIDGNTYQTVKIGNQTWMKAALRVTHYRNGDAIPEVTGNTEWSNLTTGAFCNYNNNADNVSTYGRLYNWYAVNDPRGLAPADWHIPTDEDWKTLEMALGMSQTDADAEGHRGTDEGCKMKKTGTTHWAGPNTGATNESGFTALPCGYRQDTGLFWEIGSVVHYWTATQSSTANAWWRALNHEDTGVYRYSNASKKSGFSIRCLKDN